MSQTADEIDDINKRLDLLMDFLGLEFEYQWNEVVGIKKKGATNE